MIKPIATIALVAAATIAAAGPASALGTPPVWLTGDTSAYQEWTVSSLGGTPDLESPFSFSGDSFEEEGFAAFDVVYSGSGNFVYAVGASSENLYKIDLDNNTMEIVFDDLGTDGDDAIDTIAINGDVMYVTYTNPSNSLYAAGTINNVTGEIDYLADIDPYNVPRSLAYFDDKLYVIDGGYGLSFDYVLRSVDLGTGTITDLYTLDGNVVDVYDGDIDNNGNFRTLTKDNDDITGSEAYNVLTNAAVGGLGVSAIDPNPIAYWGTPDEVTATGGGSGSGGLASTGLGDVAPALWAAILGVSAGALFVGRRRLARTR